MVQSVFFCPWPSSLVKVCFVFINFLNNSWSQRLTSREITLVLHKETLHYLYQLGGFFLFCLMFHANSVIIEILKSCAPFCSTEKLKSICFFVDFLLNQFCIPKPFDGFHCFISVYCFTATVMVLLLDVIFIRNTHTHTQFVISLFFSVFL